MQSKGAFDGWLEELIQRWSRFRSASGRLSEAGAKEVATRITSHRLPDANRTAHQHVMEVVKDERLVATFWLEVQETWAFLYDIVEQINDSDLDLLAIVEEVAREKGAEELRVNVFATDTVLTRLTADQNFITLNSQMWMLDNPSTSSEFGETGLILRPMRSDEFPEYRQQQVIGDAEAKVLAGKSTPSGAMEESEHEVARLLPDGLETDGQFIFIAEVDGERVGSVWMDIDDEAEIPTAFCLQVEINQPLRGRGFGRAIMGASLNECRKRNIRGLALSVFGYNNVARTLYESMGFKVVEEMKRKEL